MCSMSVLCPLCAHSSFASIDALRVSLIRAANGPLSCPICHELFLGLDKLTIHLFSHTTIFTAATADRTHATDAAKEINSNTSSNLGQDAVQQTAVNIQQHTATDTTYNTIPVVPTCDICAFSFRNNELLNMHMRLMHQNLGDETTTETSAQQHTDSAHMYQSGAQQCTSSTSVNKSQHDFKCHLCAKTFKMKGSLRVHLKVVHLMGMPFANSASKLNICERIRLTHKQDAATSAIGPTTTAISATTAIANAANNQLVVSTEQVLLINPTSSQPQVNNSNVNILLNSNEVAPSSNVLLELNTKESNTQPAAQQSATVVESKGSEESKSGENAKIWECDVCGKCFTTKYFLKKHKRLHTGEMPYTCEICGRTFTFQQSYHKHLLYHSDEKPHVCSTCGRAFKELSTLHNHERIHSGEKPFKCEVCEKSFRQRVSFLVHTRIHTGVMPYRCEVCQKSFRYKVSQRTHKCLQPYAATFNGAALNMCDATDEQISENFIKAFLANNTTPTYEAHNSPHSAEIADITSMCSSKTTIDDKHTMDEAMLSKTIDDIVVESCNKMGIGMSPRNALQHFSPSNSNGVNGTEVAGGADSPSLQFRNMRLYSPEMLMQQHSNEVSADSSDFSNFLMDNVGS